MVGAPPRHGRRCSSPAATRAGLAALDRQVRALPAAAPAGADDGHPHRGGPGLVSRGWSPIRRRPAVTWVPYDTTRSPAGTSLQPAQRLILATGIVLVACLFLGAGAVLFVTSKLNNFDRVEVAVDAAAKGGAGELPAGGVRQPGGHQRGRPRRRRLPRRRRRWRRPLRHDHGRPGRPPRREDRGALHPPRPLRARSPAATTRTASTPPTPTAPRRSSTRSARRSASPSTTTWRSTSGASRASSTCWAACPMYFDQPMRDEWTGLDISEPGCVVLKGPQALAFSPRPQRRGLRRQRMDQRPDRRPRPHHPPAAVHAPGARQGPQPRADRRAQDQPADGRGHQEHQLRPGAVDHLLDRPHPPLRRRRAATRWSATRCRPSRSAPRTAPPSSSSTSAGAQPTLDIFRGLAPDARHGPGRRAPAATARSAPSTVEVTRAQRHRHRRAGRRRGRGAAGLRVLRRLRRRRRHRRPDPHRPALRARSAGGGRPGGRLPAGRGRAGRGRHRHVRRGAGHRGRLRRRVPAPRGGDDDTRRAEATTTTTTPPDEITSTSHLGFAPGDPPPGVTCG